MMFLVLWNLEQSLLSEAMVRAIARMPEYGARPRGPGQGDDALPRRRRPRRRLDLRRRLPRGVRAAAGDGARLQLRALHRAPARGHDGSRTMASEVIGEALGYDELGVHRHLVVSERLRDPTTDARPDPEGGGRPACDGWASRRPTSRCPASSTARASTSASCPSSRAPWTARSPTWSGSPTTPRAGSPTAARGRRPRGTSGTAATAGAHRPAARRSSVRSSHRRNDTDSQATAGVTCGASRGSA